MTNREFLIWLLGYIQLCAGDGLNRKRLFIIKNHLNLVRAVEGHFSGVNTKIWDAVVEHLEKDSHDDDLVPMKAQLERWVHAAA
jgi:hypothetical protein